MTTVKEFIRDCYDLISAHSPTVPLHGSDEAIGIKVMNRLLKSYASTGLELTIAKTVTVPIVANQSEIVCGPADFLPLPEITEGRLANMEVAWITLTGVTYPLINITRDKFLASFRYAPLKGLPRFIIVYPETKVTRLQIYPAASQGYDFSVRGKFQKTVIAATDTLDSLPDNYELFFQYACAKQIAMVKGRAAAWTPDLEAIYRELEQTMKASSEVNLSIVGEQQSLLNGAWAVQAGV